MTANDVAVVAAPLTAAVVAYSTFQLGKRRARVDERHATVEERHSMVEEQQLAASIRDELRQVNTALQQQVAALTQDNTLTHRRLHDLGNEVTGMQGSILSLTEDRDDCRKDLSEMLAVVGGLVRGRDAMAARIDQLEGHPRPGPPDWFDKDKLGT